MIGRLKLAPMSTYVQKALYISIKGRCSRKFYWIFGLLPFYIIGLLLGYLMKLQQLNPLILVALVLASMWPVLAMQIKRWHDIGRSGWFSMLTSVPYIGFAVTIILGLIPGNSGEKNTAKPVGREIASVLNFYT